MDRTHIALRQLLGNDKITEDVYCKNIVALAARWIVLGRNDDANAMICELPSSYVAKTLPVQMATDDSFRIVALHVSKTLSTMAFELDDDDARLAPLMLEKPKAQA